MDDLSAEIENLRKDYVKKILTEETIASDPIAQFGVWFQEALNYKVEEPNAMALSTVSLIGFPETRIVLLRGVSPDGFRFFTNYNSEKGQNIAGNPKVALTFFWPEMERQVRIVGLAEKLNEEQSDNYFNTRPRQSQIGAWASDQSSELASRGELERKEQHLIEHYREKTVPRPPFWGGYVVKPVKIEFWQGRANRLHDRIRFTKNQDKWEITRLSP